MLVQVGVNRTAFLWSIAALLCNVMSVSPWAALQHFQELLTSEARTAAVCTALSSGFGFLLVLFGAYQADRKSLLALGFLAMITTPNFKIYWGRN